MILLLFGLELLALIDLLYFQFLLLLLVFLVLFNVACVWSGATCGSGQVLSVNSRTRASSFRGWSSGLGSRASSFTGWAIGFCDWLRSLAERPSSFTGWAIASGSRSSGFSRWAIGFCSRATCFTGWAIGLGGRSRSLGVRTSIVVRRTGRCGVNCSTFSGGYCAAVFEGAGLGCSSDGRLAILC